VQTKNHASKSVLKTKKWHKNTKTKSYISYEADILKLMLNKHTMTKTQGAENNMGILILPHQNEHLSSITTESGNIIFWKDYTINNIIKRCDNRSNSFVGGQGGKTNCFNYLCSQSHSFPPCSFFLKEDKQHG